MLRGRLAEVLAVVKSVVVGYTSRTWQEMTFPVSKGDYPQSFVPSIAAIRAEVATADWSVVGHGVVDGHQAIELRWKHGLGPGWGVATGTMELWVDATTFLPLEQILNETGALQQSAVDTYQFLPPTPANLAMFDVVIRRASPSTPRPRRASAVRSNSHEATKIARVDILPRLEAWDSSCARPVKEASS